MTLFEDPVATCRHDRALLRRLGKITHERTGACVYVLLCTECGFTVTTDELRRLRRGGPPRRPTVAGRPAPQWA
ncbi:MAG: hypothetical protein AMK72_06505 [Planctomycetes bacterium SM23_25]|nr:MAG: hypothetical protein AMS14_02160 [Planctomycetes bacterium DG_20]KPK48620.1 MAG: hypothetical protein AMK72_06505 [Planctomycetes bacterium SM23_25]